MLVDDRPPEVDDRAAEEAALLARVATGDWSGPLEELYRRYAGRLFRLGLRLLGDRGLAEELVQESFVRLWRQARRFDAKRGTPESFLFALSRHVAVDLWRRPSSRRFVETGDKGRDLPPGGTDPAEQVINGLIVRQALERLSPAHSEVLELSYGAGLTQAEISDRLQLPLGTVKTRTYYALRALKVALEDSGVHV